MLAVPDIRLAAPDEARTIARMSRDYIEHGLAWSWTPQRVRQSMRDPGTNVAVALRRGAIRGFGIMHYGDDSAHLALLAVEPELRHQGMGRRLVGWLEQVARTAGITQLRVEARADNGNAIAFYARLAFTQTGRITGYYEGMVDAVQMEKRLG